MAAKAKKYIGVDIGGTSIKLGIVDGREQSCKGLRSNISQIRKEDL